MNVLTFVPQSLTSFNEHHSREGFILICQHCKQKWQKKEVTLYFWRCHEILVYAHPSTIYIIFKGEEESKGTFFIKWMWMFDRSVSANKTNSILPARCSWVCFVFLFFLFYCVMLLPTAWMSLHLFLFSFHPRTARGVKQAPPVWKADVFCLVSRIEFIQLPFLSPAEHSVLVNADQVNPKPVQNA